MARAAVSTSKTKGSATNAMRRHYGTRSRKGMASPGRIKARGR
jgi:hypothetical protein